MGSKIMFLFRQPSVRNIIQHKRLRSRWVSRQPSKVMSEESEIHDDSEVKLNIERKILKKGKQNYNSENQQISSKEKNKFVGKLPESVSTRLRNLSMDDNFSINIESQIRESTKQVCDRKPTDPFALSSLMPAEEKDDCSLPDFDPSSTFPHTEATYYNSRNFDQRVHKICSETLAKVTDMEENNSRAKPKSNSANTWPPQLVKSVEGDRRLSRMILLTKSKKMREKHNLVVIEGKRLINDFINAGAIPKTLFFSREQDVAGICVPENSTELYKVTYKQLSLWTNVETSQGVVGIFELSKVLKQKPDENSLPITVICDNVRDPGNMGSILRISAGAGCEKVLLTKGCVDVWDSKVLRAAAGAHCHIPILSQLSWEGVLENLPEGCVTFAADSSPCQNGQTPLVQYSKAEFGSAPHVALVVGGETHGLSSSALSLASARLHVPISPSMDSLNTAAAFAIIVFEARRSLTAGS